MAMRKAVGCLLVLLVVYFCVEDQVPFLTVSLQEFLDARPFHNHPIEKRNTAFDSNGTDYLVEVVVEIADLELLQSWLRQFSLPLIINNTLLITAVNITTVCSPSPVGHHCRCQESYTFPSSSCHEACGAIINGRCGCISSIPADGQYCELNTSSTIPTTPMTTTEKATEPSPTAKPRTTEPSATAKPRTTEPSATAKPPAKTTQSTTVTIDHTYEPSFNDPDNEFYQSFAEIIITEYEKHVANPILKSLTFSAGSTVANYTVEAAFASADAISSAQTSLVTQLKVQYGVIFDSRSHLIFDPLQVYFGKSVTVSCGPPTESPDFGSSWTTEWRVDNVIIIADSGHVMSDDGDVAKLTISKVFLTDNGLYECRQRSEQNSIFRQRSRSAFKLIDVPQIKVSPVFLKVGCATGKNVELSCSVQDPYRVKFKDMNVTAGQSISYTFTIQDCDTAKKFTCEVVSFPQYTRDMTVEITRESFTCVNDPVFGNGLLGDVGRAPCAEDEEGEKKAVCEADGSWGRREDTCVLRVILQLLEQSEFLNNNTLPVFMEEVREQIERLSGEVAESPNNLHATVAILKNIGALAGSLSISVDKETMEDFLRVASVLTDDDTKESWDELNKKPSFNDTKRIETPNNESTSSVFLFSIENVARVLTADSFNISTANILLDKTTFANTFSADFNSTVEIDVQDSSGGSKSLTMISFASMDNVLPARDEENSSLTVINGNVVIVQSSGTIDNVSFAFDIRNTSLGQPQCVFWNFSLFNGHGGWDDEGCELVGTVNDTVTCTCDHLTGFSLLMSPFVPNDLFLAIITYIGVAISIASLLICLIIEAYTWRRMKLKDLAYLRHVCIVNIAVTLLIADIWFMIMSAVSEAHVTTPGTCSTATFFVHFFYLAMFFWMLMFGLLLMKSMVSVFNTGGGKGSMLAIGFSVGYGAPLLIAVITIAVTAPNDQYTVSPTLCWLNFVQSKALLAFVVPALMIVAANLVILIFVLFKMLKRELGNSGRRQQQSDVIVIIRTVAILSPFFGLTWSLGVGTMVDPFNIGLHIAFAFFNSLQGFFILVFGTLWDRKVRKELGLSSISSASTRNTTSGTSSSGLLGGLRRQRGSHQVSTAQSSGNT